MKNTFANDIQNVKTAAQSKALATFSKKLAQFTRDKTRFLQSLDKSPFTESQTMKRRGRPAKNR